MKKRILSLLLAFAMAATLAPATALVGTSVSKAAPESLSIKFELQTTSGGSITYTPVTSVQSGKATGGATLKMTNDSSNTNFKVYLGGTNKNYYDLTVSTFTEKKGVFTGTLASSGTTTIRVTPKSGLARDGKVTKLYVEETDNDGKTLTTSLDIVDDTSGDEWSLISAKDTPVTISYAELTPAQDIYGGVADRKNFYIIDKQASGFKFTISPDSGYTIVGLSGVGTGTEKPDGGNLSFGSEKTKTNAVVYTVKNIDKLKSGFYTFILKLRYTGATTDVSTSLSFQVTNTYKATLDLAGGAPAGRWTWLDDTKGNFYKWSTPESDLGDTKIALPIEDEVARPGYTFKGWKANKTYEPGAEVAMTSDMTFTAIWAISGDYEIYLNGDSAAIDSAESLGTEVVKAKVGNALPENPFKRVGYSFVGWTDVANGGYAKYADKAPVTDKLLYNIRDDANPSLYAVWAPITYTVKFDANIPANSKLSVYNVNMNDAEVVYGEGGLLEKDHRNTYSVNNYAFAGWSTDKEGYNTLGDFGDINVNPEGKGEVTLYAQWNEGNSVVVYKDDYEATTNSVYIVSNQNDYDGEQPRVGYTHNGHTYKDGTAVAGALDYDENGIAVVYPSYTKADEWVVTYIITNGSTGNEINKVTVNSGNVSFPKVTPVSSSWKLVGWDLLETEDKTEKLTGSFSALDIITTITKLEAANGNNNPDKQVTFEAIMKPIANDANMTNTVSSTVDDVIFGTTKAYIDGMIAKVSEVLYGNKSSLANAKNNGVDSVSVSLDKAYNSMPKEDTTNATTTAAGRTEPYKVSNVRVKANSSFYNAGSSYSAGVNTTGNNNVFSVESKNLSINKRNLYANDIVVKSFSSASDISLAKGANAWDIIDAVKAVEVGQRITASADDSKKYAFNLNEKGANGTAIVYGNGRTAGYDRGDEAALQEWLDDDDFDGELWVEYVFDTAANNTHNTYGNLFLGLTTTSGGAIRLPNGLKEIDVNIKLTDKSYADLEKETDKDTDKEEEIAKAIAEAKAFLDQGIAVRLLLPSGDHFYISVSSEVEALIKAGAKHETTGANSFKFSPVKTDIYDTPIYRLSRTGFGPHYAAEKECNDILAAAPGVWTVNNGGEPIFYVSMNPAGNQVYRLYRPSLGVHHLAVKAERDAIMAAGADWVDETDATNTWFTPAN